MKILHLTTFLQGGAGRVIADLAMQQRQRGHDVRVMASLTGTIGYGNYRAWLDELQAASVPLRLVDSMFARDHAQNLAAVTALDDWYEAEELPDVIHSHAATPGMVGLMFSGARGARAVMVQTMHGWGRQKTAEQAASDVAVLNLMDRVIVASRHSVGTLEGLGVMASRITQVPYGIGRDVTRPDAWDADLLDQMARARQQGRLVVACVGTVGARKQQALLVEALTLTDTPLMCVFIGDGEVDALRQQVREAGVESSVHIHGYSRAARRLTASADLLVLPSTSEGQPLSVIEAFSDGTLVAVSDIPELSELVGRPRGFQFESGDATALARTLDRVSRLPDPTGREIRARARAWYRTHFTVEAMTGAYLDVYHSAMTSRASSRHAMPAA
jgi:glycosyltransferase involved in cell wall biosynthesis